MLSDEREKIKGAVRLRKIAGSPGIPGLLIIVSQGERRDDQDRRVCRFRRGPQSLSGLDARKPRQLHVHEDKVRALCGGLGDASLAVVRLDKPVLGALQEVADDLAVQLVVFDVKDGLLAHAVVPPLARTGTVKKKVDPLPGSLSTQVRPPCISTNFLVML